MTEDLRAQFDVELRAAGLALDGRDEDRLFTMWTKHRPDRAALRRAALAADEEPDA